VLSAIVIGSMVPDFGWFLPWLPGRFETHSAIALVTWSLPVGLATYWIFQYLIKTPVREVLPDGAYGRSLPYAPIARITAVKQWLYAAGGILVGAVTHLVWDGFTRARAAYGWPPRSTTGGSRSVAGLWPDRASCRT
jgi:hypothetical protein